MNNLNIYGENASIELYDFEYFDKNITCSWKVKDSMFSGKSSINFLMTEINSKLQIENFELCDYDSDQFIRVVKIDDIGHFEVSIKIGSSHSRKCLNTYFTTDQISISTFKNNFLSLLKLYNL